MSSSFCLQIFVITLHSAAACVLEIFPHLLTNRVFSSNKISAIISRTQKLAAVPCGTILNACLQAQYCITNIKQQKKTLCGLDV